MAEKSELDYIIRPSVRKIAGEEFPSRCRMYRRASSCWSYDANEVKWKCERKPMDDPVNYVVYLPVLVGVVLVEFTSS